MSGDGGDLAGWLLEQIAEDERLARAAVRWKADHRPAMPGWPAETWPAGDGRWTANGCYVVGIDIDIYDEGGHSPQQAQHIAVWDPARVLAECAAKRAIIELYVEALTWPTQLRAEAEGSESLAAEIDQRAEELAWPIRLLAQPHAGRPGWRAEWAVT